MLLNVQMFSFLYLLLFYQVFIAQWLTRWLATGVVPGSNPGKGKHLLISDKNGNSINLNLNTIIVWVYELAGLV